MFLLMQRFLWIAVLSIAAAAQMNIASLTGIVTDPTGATIPGARVVVTALGTGIAQTTETNEAGVFLVPSLNPGAYRVEVTASGFKPKSVEAVRVSTGERARIDIALVVGEVTDQIEVIASAPLLQSETAEISKGIDTKEVIDVPISVSRSAYQFMMLSTGIAARGSSTSPEVSAQTSINGSRAQNTAFVIDGASTTHIGGIGELVGTPESIQEVKLLTSSYSAEYGRTSGATVIFQVKSGTNRYRGSLFQYNRNNAYAAQNWADNARGVPATNLNINQFGATFGGPVPGLKDRLFFFGSYESQIDRRPNSQVRTIPDPAIRGGNFSSVPIRVNDPVTRTPFSGNIIPASRLDPAAVNFMRLFPAPNQAGIPNANFGIAASNFLRLGSSSDPLHTGTGRVDYNVTANDKIFFTYSQNTQGPRDQGINFDNVLNTTLGPRTRNIYRATLGYSRVIRPNLINEFLAHAQRDPRVIDPWFPDFDTRSELGIGRTIGTTMPTINMSNAFGGYGNSNYQNWVHQPAGLSNLMTWVKGRHNLRFGVQYLQNQFWYVAANNTSGTYNFNGEMTALGLTGQNNPINPLADLMLGLVKTASAPVPQIPVNRTNTNVGLFLQDDWKLSRRLTLNLGLRYEFDTKQRVRNNVYSRLDLTTGQLLVAGINATPNLNLADDFVNFSPRLGAAYLLNDRTVLRAGFAIFHSNFWVDNGEMVAYPGWTTTTDWPNLGLNVAQPFRLSNGFPTEQIPPVADPLAQFASSTIAQPLPHPSVSYDPNDRLPYSLQWNFSIQRQVGAGFVAEAAYVGTRGVRLGRIIPSNQPTLDRAPELLAGVPIQRVRPFPTVAGFNSTLYDATSIYHSLQLKGARRFASGFSLDLNYTFSKLIDTSSRFAESFQIPWQFANIERGLSSFDFPYVFSAAGVYELPFGRNKRWQTGNRVADYIIGGFQLNAALIAQSGITLAIRQNNLNPLLSAQRPDVIDPSNLRGRVSQTSFEGPSLRWLVAPTDPSFPYRVSSSTGIGNLGRNISRGPGSLSLNSSLFKKLFITESLIAELRLEAFNALNRVNFGDPQTNINTANYGLITGADAPRQVQIGIRISF